MKKIKDILVTGGAGFVGTNLVKSLSEEGHKITVIDNLKYGNRLNYLPGVNYCEANTYEIFELNIDKPDIIFHLGEYSKVTPSFEEIDLVFDLNVRGSFSILEYARKYNIPIVYAGSSTRLASEGPGHSPYSFFKSCTVDLLKNYNRWYGVRYNVCYFYNVYGELQDTCNNGWETVISIFEKQYRSNKPLTVVGDGKQRRDFTYVGDIVDGLIKASLSFKQDEYQLGSGKDYSILEVARLFSDNIVFIKSRQGDRKKGKANVEETFTKLNWKPKGKLIDWISKVKKNT